MADLQQYGFDANQHDTTDNFTPIPAGLYKITMEESELKDTSAKTGKYLNCKFSVLEGQYKGRKLFHMINLVNPNQQCVEIGMKSLAQIGKAVKIPKPADSTQLHGLPLMGRVAVVKDEYTGPDAPKNEIKHFSGIGEASQRPSLAPEPAQAVASADNKPAY